MTEENVTKQLLKYLKDNSWNIISYDFPQSGSGISFLPDENISSKNKDSIIPDIIAYKNGICVFFENKDRLVISDFNKVNNLIKDNKYINNISNFLNEFNISTIYYGIGIPINVKTEKVLEYAHLVDFVIKVDLNVKIEIVKDLKNIFKK